MNRTAEKYPPGTEWLYLRIYGGPGSLEEWLAGPFRILLEGWLSEGIIVGFHFVRYLDPDYHLRIRMRLNDPAGFGPIVASVSDSCVDQLGDDRFWKVEVGTYEPELGRYGPLRIRLAESWFAADSLFWIRVHSMLRSRSGTEPWLCAMVAADRLLDDFGLDLEGRILVLEALHRSAAELLDMPPAMQHRIDSHHRQHAQRFRWPDPNLPEWLDEMLNRRSAEGAGIIKALSETYPDSQALAAGSLLPDLLHLGFNRAFRTRHREQELIVCDWLVRIYRSQKIRAER